MYVEKASIYKNAKRKDRPVSDGIALLNVMCRAAANYKVSIENVPPFYLIFICSGAAEEFTQSGLSVFGE